MDLQNIISAEDVEGLDMQSLATSEPSAVELSPLQFDREDYTPFEVFVHRLGTLPEKPARVHNYALSVRGRVANDRMEKYLDHEGESSSLLKEALKSPRHYLVARNMDLKPRNTDHFELGSFAHMAILEPARFERVIVEPKANRGQIAGVCALIEFYSDLLTIPQTAIFKDMKLSELRELLDGLESEAAARGYTAIPADYAAIIRAMKVSFNTYGGGILPQMMRFVKTETSMYGRDAATGLKVKIRPDGLLLEEDFGMNAILSVKTTSATSVEAFMRDCAKFRYELAEGMYLKVASEITGRRFTGTVMIMAQTVMPYQVAVLYWDAEDLQIGKYKYAQALDIVAQCRAANHWPGFDAKAETGAYGIIQAKLPGYIKAELLPQYLPEA
ncbi:MAG: PD-(D/E)XK nuclease-like domain-containing protein [Alistipes sp.]|nr:PD-(D/E)XK nuclease-like domain-containing protein [Alistipes sp.]